MKNIITPTETEIILEDDAQIISKTDTQGIITYCNPLFIEVSGYQESELLGHPHNMMRHPEMPKVIFHLLWDTLKKNHEFNGYIKNICKDGSFYWTFTNISPSTSCDNELLGYYSVSRKADPEKLNYIKNIYLEFLEIEQELEEEEGITASMNKLNSILNGREVGYNEFILTL